MGARGSQAFALGLLLAAGAGFAWIGWRSVRLERVEAERRERVRADEALSSLASAPWPSPATLPEALLEVWRLDPADSSPVEASPESSRLLLAEAAYRERSRDDPSEALVLLERLAAAEPPTALSRVAAFRAGALARRLGDAARARPWLETAADSPPDLADPAGPLVRFAALRHLAVMDLEGGSDQALRRLLDEADDGRRLRADGGLDAGDALVGIARSLPTDAIDPALRERLAAAIARADLGHRVIAALPPGPSGIAASRFAWREGERLVSAPLSSLGALFASVESAYGVRIGATSDPSEVPADARSLRLPPPLDGAIAFARVSAPRPPPPTWIPVAAGLAVYALGAGLALASLRRQARVARMQTDFVAAVSHEMKTPVAAVQAMAERLADGAVAVPDRARAYAERIHAEMLRLGTSVRNVLDASRIERGSQALVRPAPGDPAEVVTDVADSVRPLLERRGFRFDVESRPAARALPMDADALRSVLGNLLDNAAKFSSDRKEVAVRAGPRRDGGFRIEVLDRGPGVPPAEREQVFRRFYRGPEARRGAVPGLGLGLHVARELVLAHGGSLTVAEREGGGAAFVVDLPDAA